MIKTLKWIFLYPLILLVDIAVYLIGIFFSDFRSIFIRHLKIAMKASLEVMEKDIKEDNEC